MPQEIVTGMPAAIGYTSGYSDYGRGNYNNYNCGISDKDQMFASSIDAGERTRDVLHSIRDTVVAVEKTGAANSLATEKIGAANMLATEKTGAAMLLTAEKIGAANVQATHDQSHLLALQLCDLKSQMLLEMQKCCCDIKESVVEVKATVLSVDANRIRDDLRSAQTELLLLRSGNGNGNGNK